MVEFGKDLGGNDIPKTIISKEFSSEWKVGDEPYYPVNDEANMKLYIKALFIKRRMSSLVDGKYSFMSTTK